MAESVESVASFRQRARTWLAANVPRLDDVLVAEADDDIEVWLQARRLQKALNAGGFAGICFPDEYGGLGLTLEHQQAFSEESLGYQMPLVLNAPSFSICCATLLDVGSEEQKREHIGAAIRGEEVLCQFLSEPGGGSDLAGVTTRADRDGGTWILNGAKTWSTSAYAADYALCLARTDWDVPKHAGLTMFLVPTKAPGITLNRVRMVNGSLEFCEEFFDDVVLPDSAVVGEVGNGWAVASRQLFHERTAVGGGSPYVSGRGVASSNAVQSPIALARATGKATDPAVRELVGSWVTQRAVKEQTARRISRAISEGVLPVAAASMARLLGAEDSWHSDDVRLRIAGEWAAVGRAGEPGLGGRAGVDYLMRQGTSLGGGSTEMARNIISERLLGMPREVAPDRGVPFRDIPRGRS